MTPVDSDQNLWFTTKHMVVSSLLTSLQEMRLHHCLSPTTLAFAIVIPKMKVGKDLNTVRSPGTNTTLPQLGPSDFPFHHMKPFIFVDLTQGMQGTQEDRIYTLPKTLLDFILIPEIKA